MGSSISCLCTQLSTLDEVLVMKQDGKLLGYKEGTTVKAVLTENPHQKIVVFCQERTVPSDSFQLRCDQFYLLLPEELELNDENYRRLLRLVIIKGRINGGGNFGEKTEERKREKVAFFSGNNVHSRVESRSSWQNRWKPELDAIPEVNSTTDMH